MLAGEPCLPGYGRSAKQEDPVESRGLEDHDLAIMRWPKASELPDRHLLLAFRLAKKPSKHSHQPVVNLLVLS